MDSILLLEKLESCNGKQCKVSVSNGDEYVGCYKGAQAYDQLSPLAIILSISKSEAARIGIPYLQLIGIPYDVITSIKIEDYEE